MNIQAGEDAIPVRFVLIKLPLSAAKMRGIFDTMISQKCPRQIAGILYILVE